MPFSQAWRALVVGSVGLLLVGGAYGQAIDPTKNFCTRWDQQSTILNGTLYIDGGVETFWDGTTRNSEGKAGSIFIGTNRNLISLPLRESWNWRNTLPFTILDAGQRVSNNTLAPPTLVRGTLWGYNNSLYLYGGSTSRLNESFFGYQPPRTEDTVMWRFSIETSLWAPVELTVSGGAPGRKVPRLAGGASALAEDKGLAFYYGGQVDNGTSPDTVGQSGIRFSNEFWVFDLERGSARSLTAGDALGGDGRSDAQMVYIAGVGAKGILVMTGGSRKGAGVTDSRFKGDMVPMSEIAIFDIASLDSGGRGWFNQTASGNIPRARFGFCLVVALAPDKSSYNLYAYGGWDGTNKYDDVYILSLPSFEWISAFIGVDEREAHNCHNAGRVMVSTGGHKARLGLPGQCDWEPNGISLFDMVNMTWPGVYIPPDSSYNYNISSIITEKIGGNATGGATRKGPRESWTPGLERVFSGLPSNITTTPFPAPPSPKPLSKKTIIGITIGSLLLLLLLSFITLQIYKIRKAPANAFGFGRRLPPVELEPSTRIPLSAFQELLGSLGRSRNARAAMELPGCLPPGYVRSRDSNGDPFELSGMGENNRCSVLEVLPDAPTAVAEVVCAKRESTSTAVGSSLNAGSPGSNRNSMTSVQVPEKINMNWI